MFGQAKASLLVSNPHRQRFCTMARPFVPLNHEFSRLAVAAGPFSTASSTVCPSAPDAPLFRNTFSSACARLATDATDSIVRLLFAAVVQVADPFGRCPSPCATGIAFPGFVPGHAILVPFRAVGECEGQLPWSSASQSISPFALPACASFIASMRRSDFSAG